MNEQDLVVGNKYIPKTKYGRRLDGVVWDRMRAKNQPWFYFSKKNDSGHLCFTDREDFTSGDYYDASDVDPYVEGYNGPREWYIVLTTENRDSVKSWWKKYFPHDERVFDLGSGYGFGKEKQQAKSKGFLYDLDGCAVSFEWFKRNVLKIPFILPDVWYVTVTEENREILSRWRFDSPNGSGLEVGQITGLINGSKEHNPGRSPEPFNKTEISFEDFKEYVLGEKISTDTLPEPQEEIFVLPENWYVILTKENTDEFKEWWESTGGYPNFYSPKSAYGIRNGTHTVYAVKSDGTEISFENFKKYFVTDGDVLPEKWFIQRNPGNAAIINEWYNKKVNRGAASAESEYLFFSDDTGYGDFGRKEALNKGYTEINFEQFKKYVMKKEKQNITGYKAPKNLFGGKVTEGCIYRYNGNHGSYMPNHGNGLSSSFAPLSAQLPSEIVETWEPIYENISIKMTIGSKADVITLREGDSKVEISRGGYTEIAVIKALVGDFDTLNGDGSRVIADSWATGVDEDIRFIRIGCMAENHLFSLNELKSVIAKYNKINNN